MRQTDRQTDAVSRSRAEADGAADIMHAGREGRPAQRGGGLERQEGGRHARRRLDGDDYDDETC